MPVSLLDIPRELRNEIYQLVYLRLKGIDGLVHPYNHRRVVQSHPGLLRTCSQIYKEASPYLYRQSVFKLHAPHQSYQWIKTIGPRNASQIRQVLLESSFLTHDIDQAGQQIAAQTWAKVLRSLSSLRRLFFLYPESTTSSNSWTKSVFQNGQTDFADALRGLVELRDLHYSDLSHLAILNNKPYLENLAFSADMRAEEGRSIESYFDSLSRLRNLSLTGNRKATILPASFFTHVAPLHSLNWTNLGKTCLSRSHLEVLVDRHASSLRDLSLGCKRRRKGVDHLGNEDFLWLIRGLPHLTSLRLQDLPIDSSLVVMLSTHVRSLTLMLNDQDPQSIASNLKLLSAKQLHPNHCIRLWYVAHVSDTDISWEPLHQVIRELRGEGIDIESECCRDTCHTDIHSEHIDQSGLIP